jgi:hypothetical protein
MNLLEFQRTVGGAIMAPFTNTVDRTATSRKAQALIRPNNRLTSLERLEIYRRSYWCRVLDSLLEDFPGLCAVLGPRRFNRLAKSYLADQPSASFTLRDLGSRLEAWLGAHPDYAGANLALALDMARLEWAHIEAYDAAEHQRMGPEDLLELGAESKVGLQPHIRMLELQYPVDDLRIRVHQLSSEKRSRAARNLKPEPLHLAVHRIEFAVYYRRLAAGEFQILQALESGNSLGEAVSSLEDSHDMVEGWFASWSRMGWFCHPAHEGV